jgi:hypothetical protein
LVDERLLPFECLDCGTTGQGVFAGCGIGNLRIELGDRPEPFGLLADSAVQRLALPVLRPILEINPGHEIIQKLLADPHRCCCSEHLLQNAALLQNGAARE